MNSTVIDLALSTDAEATQQLLVTQLQRFSHLRKLNLSGKFIVASHLFTQLLQNSSINSIILSGGFKFIVSDMVRALSAPNSAASLRSLDCEDVEDNWGLVSADHRRADQVDRLIRITKSRVIKFSGSTLDDHLEYIKVISSYRILSHSELQLILLNTSNTVTRHVSSTNTIKIDHLSALPAELILIVLAHSTDILAPLSRYLHPLQNCRLYRSIVISDTVTFVLLRESIRGNRELGLLVQKLNWDLTIEPGLRESPRDDGASYAVDYKEEEEEEEEQVIFQPDIAEFAMALPNLRLLDCCPEGEVGDYFLRHIANFQNLRVLRMEAHDIAGLQKLSSLWHLEDVYIQFYECDPQGCVYGPFPPTTGAVAMGRKYSLQRLVLTGSIGDPIVTEFVAAVEALDITLSTNNIYDMSEAIAVLNPVVINLYLGAGRPEALPVTRLTRLTNIQKLKLCGQFDISSDFFTILLRTSTIHSLTLARIKIIITDLINALSNPTSAPHLKKIEFDFVTVVWGRTKLRKDKLAQSKRLREIAKSRGILLSGRGRDGDEILSALQTLV